MILIAHAFGDRRVFYTDVAEQLSSRGYVVVVPHFRETSNSLSSSGDFVEQPGDLVLESRL